MAVLAFVGVDKTGKTTLFQEILKRTNRHICIDRFTACQFVYGNIHGKNGTPGLNELRKIEEWLSNSPIPFAFIHVTAHTNDIINRFNIHKEKDIEISQIQCVKDSYTDYLLFTPMKVLNINTSKKGIDECVKEIIDFADSLH